MKAIPTEYHGVKFKSKLEAKWAEWLDENDIKWGYEIEGFNLDGGVWYLPDFYLPEINTFIEVKGAMERIEKPFKLMQELRKKTIEQMKNQNISGECNYTNERIENADYNPDGNIMLLLAGPVGFFYNITSSYFNGFRLNKCPKCGKISIVTDLGDYSCRSCGHHEGPYATIGTIPVLAKPLEWLLLEEDKEPKTEIHLVDFLKG